MTVGSHTIPTTVVGRSFHLLRTYVALTKPRVIELLIVSTIPVMLLAHRGTFQAGTIFATLFGGWLGAGSANTLNMVVDADIDQKMNRTRKRPLVKEAISKTHALIYGLALGLASLIALGWFTNVLAAVLVLATIAFYVLIYTLILKRRTWQNVIWGGAAGCMPALVGWAGATGKVQWPALVFFLVVFFWTPPHTWALAMHYRDDYASAGVPMLPVIKSADFVAKQMLFYTVVTVLCSFLLIPVTGVLYATVAVITGLWFIVSVASLKSKIERGEPVKPMRIFLQSNAYLALLCLALSIDSLLNLPLSTHVLHPYLSGLL